MNRCKHAVRPRVSAWLVQFTGRLSCYFLCALLVLLLTEGLARRCAWGGLLFLAENPIAFLVNYGLVLLTLLPALFFPRRIVVLALLSSVWLTLGIVEYVLLSFRVTPLTSVDFCIFRSVASIINIYLAPWQIVLIGLAVCLFIAAIVLLFLRTPRVRVPLRKASAGLVCAVLCVALTIACGIQVEAIGDRFPNLSEAYNEYGFAYCFSMTVVDKGISRPEEYSEEVIEDTLECLDEPESVAHKPNVILVQLESFFDVNHLRGFTYSENPVPNFTQLKQQGISGYLTVPVVGAGTVNSECEVLTGMRVNDFGAGEYPFKSILSEVPCETIAYDLAASGYATHAIHNHTGTFYSRDEVYHNLGFDSFTPIESFLHPEYNENGWAKDSILTDEILDALRSTSGPDFVFTVSVQCHGKYPSDFVPEDGQLRITSALEDDDMRSRYEYYINQLRQCDAFVGALAQAVMELDEDTVLVFYGDHLPSLSIEDDMLENGSIFQTEYIILANYPLPEQIVPGNIAAYELFPYVMELIGNDTGVMNLFHRSCRDEEDYLERLEALEYDLLYGEQYACDASGERLVPTEMVIGTRPVRVRRVSISNGMLYLTGDRFTPYSVIVLDGERALETTYVSEHILCAPLDDESAQSVCVQQRTRKDDVLAESNTLPLALSGQE